MSRLIKTKRPHLCNYNALQVCDSRTYKALYLSCLGAKDTTQSLWEMLVSLLKKCCCHKKCCGHVGCAESSVAKQ